MSEGIGLLNGGAKWLLEEWLEKLTGVIASMTDDQPSTSWSVDGEDELGESALILEQRFAGIPEPMLWLGLPESVHQDLGGRVLVGAGLETSDAEENRATCLEVIEQSLSGLTGALTKRLAREINREPAKPCPSFPSGLPILRAAVAFGEKSLAPLWIAFAPSLVSWLDAKPAEQSFAKQVLEKPAESAQELLPVSRTFELLLDVALPVSISFGKTEMAVKEVLKLTTGSIVELDRSVSEPVDVIVNGCTIARGEVVVVDGNYGVRINSIVSRKERLRTGGAAVAETRARVSAA